MGLSPCVVPKNLFLEKIAPYARDAHARKWSGSGVEKLKIFSPDQMASNFYNFAREEISSVPTFKDLDSHNEKVTIERRHKSWKKHIDHMTLRVKSKRRQNGGAACVATVE